MARGNQRDKAREKAQKAAAGTVRNLALLQEHIYVTLDVCGMENSTLANFGNKADPCIEDQEQHDRY